MTASAGEPDALLDEGFLNEVLNRADQVESPYQQVVAGPAPSFAKIAALVGLARFSRKHKRRGEAIAHLIQALALMEHEAGPNSVELVPSLRRLAAVHLEDGDPATALTTLERAQAILARDPTVDALDRIEILRSLGTVLVQLKRDAEARIVLEATLTTQEKALGPGHHSSGATLATLTDLARRNGQDETQLLYERAVSVQGLAIEAQERAVDAPHSSIIVLTERLARFHQRQGNHEEAIRLFTVVLHDKETIVGLDNPSTIATVVGLAYACTLHGEHARAEALFDRAIKTQEASNDPLDDLRLASTLTYLAKLRRTQQRAPEAQELLDRAKALRRGEPRDGGPQPDGGADEREDR